MALVLGDNIFYGQSFSKLLQRVAAKESGATIFGYYVRDQIIGLSYTGMICLEIAFVRG